MTRLCLGKITTAHGIRGYVKVQLYGDDPGLLNGALYTSESGDKTITLKMKSAMGNLWLAEVEGIPDRNAAEALRNTELWIDRAELPDIGTPGQYYITDLIGLSAIDEQGRVVGKIIGVDNFGAGDLLDIVPAGGGESFYVPFSAPYLVKASLEEGVVVVSGVEDFSE
jgi:16S rRNA processing protein RimM